MNINPGQKNAASKAEHSSTSAARTKGGPTLQAKKGHSGKPPASLPSRMFEPINRLAKTLARSVNSVSIKMDHAVHKLPPKLKKSEIFSGFNQEFQNNLYRGYPKTIPDFVTSGPDVSFRDDRRYHLFTNAEFLNHEVGGSATYPAGLHSINQTLRCEFGLAMVGAFAEKAAQADVLGKPYPLDQLKSELKHIFTVYQPEDTSHKYSASEQASHRAMLEFFSDTTTTESDGSQPEIPPYPLFLNSEENGPEAEKSRFDTIMNSVTTYEEFFFHAGRLANDAFGQGVNGGNEDKNALIRTKLTTTKNGTLDRKSAYDLAQDCRTAVTLSNGLNPQLKDQVEASFDHVNPKGSHFSQKNLIHHRKLPKN